MSETENQKSAEELLEKAFALRGKNVGCSVKLRGRVVLVAFLVNEGEPKAWDKATEKLAAKCLEEICEELMMDSGLNKAQLNIAYACCQVDVTDLLQQNEGKGCFVNRGRIISDVLKQFGEYADVEEYQRHYEEKFDRDEACVSFLFNRSFRSFAQRITEDTVSATEDPEGEEYSIVSFDSQNVQKFKTVFKHELMHQFGAMDFYYPTQVKLEAERLLPDSIMNSGSTIDNLTRYVIGWDEEIKQDALEFLRAIDNIPEAEFACALNKEWKK